VISRSHDKSIKSVARLHMILC